MASTLGFSITPSCTIILAPQIFLPSGSKSAGLSSAGWKMNFTLPGSSSFMPASTSAVAIRMAVCVSWPQACITSTSLPR